MSRSLASAPLHLAVALLPFVLPWAVVGVVVQKGAANVAMLEARQRTMHARPTVLMRSEDPEMAEQDSSDLLQISRDLLQHKPTGVVNSSGRIPRQLVLTAKMGSLAEMPELVRQNVHHMLARSPGIKLRWFGDSDCQAYIRQHFDAELAQIFETESRGSFRGDICRACVLSREGGFYLDLDVELNVALPSLVDENTTFVSAFTEDNAILNAVMGTAPNSPVMLKAVEEIRMWYTGKASHVDKYTSDGWMGPITLLRALRAVVDSDCAGHSLQVEGTLQWSCGPQVFRLYHERPLDCSIVSEECPKRRAESAFGGVRFGIFAPPAAAGQARQLVAWPRFADCGQWGCSAGGWDQNHAAVSDLGMAGAGSGA
eukprot:CAMPEP_0203863372 /NCGR_PEP_ID=MMETSP0359-20131031/14126_1 /ASSEMBLY_ACC=CAM_ASM_000338 /TAXON_ID=268821 /ORGANISM="Scrippsiella Hangoei, Strain SHTV-5" /LENGTH=370 /DNA_ID=CAMNT_0050780901 /DNA_START=98 /DNA_END=1210 /DNA_ORIENTATION=+